MNKEKFKILIVEDDLLIAKYLKMELETLCYEVTISKNGLKAIDYIVYNNSECDLILMDISMPEMNGYEATQQIREFNKDVIIIAQTAFVLSGDREKAFAAGCNDYIAKPIKQNEIKQLMLKYN